MINVEAAVLAGAIAWHDRGEALRRDAGRKAPDGGPWRWEHLRPEDQAAALVLARAIVVPALAAVGLLDAEQAAS